MGWMMCAASPTSASLSRDECARREQAERKCAARAATVNLAETQAETLFQFGVEFGIGQRDDPLGLAGVFRPHDRASLAGQWQDRERTGGQEMFFGATIMIALVRDRRHDRRLVVVPAVACDAGLLADHRMRAVGSRPEGARRSTRHRPA